MQDLAALMIPLLNFLREILILKYDVLDLLLQLGGHGVVLSALAVGMIGILLDILSLTKRLHIKCNTQLGKIAQVMPGSRAQISILVEDLAQWKVVQVLGLLHLSVFLR